MKRNLLKSKKKKLAGVCSPAILHAVYANTLTGLIPDLYAGLDVVSRELVGMIPSVSRNSTAERAALNENVTYPVVPAAVASDITPAMTPPTPAGVTVGYGQLAITKARSVPFGFAGEEQKGLNNGPGYLSIQGQMFAQALRTLTNEIELDLATEGYQNASRAYGTAGATPFGTNTGESAQIRKILDDNGAPPSGRSLVIDTGAGANLRTLNNLTRVNEAGTSMTLRDGELLNLNGFSIKESAQIQRVVAGTGASATTNTAGYAIGATVITLASAGTGTILAGDYVTLAGDANKYLVVTGDADTSNGGTFTIAAPGLRQAIAASATNITVVGTSTRSLGFSPDAMQLVTRMPALPVEGDSAKERMTLIDPRSGLAFDVAIYAGYHMVSYEVGIAWGKKAIKRQHIAALLG